MTTQYEIPRQSQTEINAIQCDEPSNNQQCNDCFKKKYILKIYFNNLENEVKVKTKCLTRNQIILGGIALVITISFLLAFLIPKSSSTEDNVKANNIPRIPITYATYQQDIMAGQQDNLIQIINVPNAQRQYNYTIINNKTIINSDGTTSIVSLPSVYSFSVVCVSVNQSEFDMILYFTQSKITALNNISQIFQDYPINQGSNQQKTTVQNADYSGLLFDPTNFNQLQNLNSQEIQILKSLNIDSQDFLNSNLPIVRFQILKNGQVGSIQKPLNMRYDLQQILLNVLEQISPNVQKSFYNTTSYFKEGNKRMLKGPVKNTSNRFMNAQNNQTVLDAVVLSDFDGKLKKNYDNSDANDNTYQTHYNQNLLFQNGALSQSNVSSQLQLFSNSQSLNQDLNVFRSAEINSQGQIQFWSQQDQVESQFLQQLIQDQEKMLKLNLTWQQAYDLQNKVQQYDNNNVSSNTGRLLQSQSLNQNIIGKAIDSPIFQNYFSSINLQSNFFSECDNDSTLQKINCRSGFKAKFQDQIYQLQQQNLSQIYSNVTIDKKVKQLNYLKNNVYNLMGTVTQKVSNQVQTAIDLINSLISRSSAFQNNIIQNLSNTVNQNIQILNNTMNQFNAFTYNYSVSVINATSSFVKKYNDSLLSQYPAYVNLVNITFNNTVIEFDSRIAKLRSLINNIIQNNLTISKNTYNALRNITDNEYLYFSIAFNQSQYWQPGYICSLAQQTLNVTNFIQQNSNMDIYNQSVANYTPIWSQIRTNVTNGTSTKLQINLYNNFAAVLASMYVKSGPSVYLTYPVTVFSNQAQFQSSPFAIFYTTSSNQYAQGGIDDSALVDTIRQSEQASDLDNQVAQLQALFDTPIDFRSTYQSFLNDFYQLLKTFTDDESAVQPQYQNYILDWMTQGYNKSFSLPKLLQEANLNVIGALNQTIPIVQNEYDQQTAIIGSTSSQILSQISSIYNTVNAFLSDTNYPDNDPLSNQTPQEDTKFNSTVFGITNDYLAQQINQLANLLPQLHTVVDNLTNYGPQISLLINDMRTYLQNYKIQLPQIPQAIFTPTFQTTFKTLISNYVAGFSLDADRALNNLKLDTTGIANIQQFYSRLNQFISTDMQSSFTNNLMQQQNQMIHNYNLALTQIQSSKSNLITTDQLTFGNSKTQLNNYESKLQSINYTYVYPSPIGFNLKLNLQVNWTSGIQTTLTTQANNILFQTQSNLNLQVQGYFSALFGIVEVGAYINGSFLSAQFNSTINTNMTDNTGTNSLLAQYDSSKIQIQGYSTQYIPQIVSSCTNNANIGNNNGIKSTVLSALYTNSSNVVGKIPHQQCQTQVQASIIQSSIFNQINQDRKPQNQIIINQNY
ncbi:transmembrane protein, putative (macronuclear) [Tetrahymena thermophila SB210]|uniref:Transmembrane protein, putative n=1 Tax=Tetrahymena thermophila (strain SB210) TaxID=312017 RepID=I7LZS2_TETTS|nr:transmembrane protein, putative [Tetrahymena thermophila SB210]EAR84814.2 transmembrane protein, putative [Tetrahymena thermophila SB210]|eukprot:XP_001032477.2 transmembrane protein, putative [Tetrahymena thermophila SB210]